MSWIYCVAAASRSLLQPGIPDSDKNFCQIDYFAVPPWSQVLEIIIKEKLDLMDIENIQSYAEGCRVHVIVDHALLTPFSVKTAFAFISNHLT